MTMEMTRRGLFKFGAAAALTAAVTPVALAASTPILWGDGEHDDTLALQAILNGRPVSVGGRGLIAHEGYLRGGKFLVTDTITVERDSIELVDVEFIANHDHAALTLKNVNSVRITSLTLRRRNDAMLFEFR